MIITANTNKARGLCLFQVMMIMNRVSDIRTCIYSLPAGPNDDNDDDDAAMISP